MTDAESAGTVEKLSLADLTLTDSIASGQTEDLDLVATGWRGECEHSGAEEHGFIIWVPDEEEDSFIAEPGRWRIEVGTKCIAEEPEDEGAENNDCNRGECHSERQLSL